MIGALVFSLAACVEDAPVVVTEADLEPVCAPDADGDGYGAGWMCAGADCDDQNPRVHTQTQCIARCDEDPHAAGCPCDPSESLEPETCFEGPGTPGVGVCRAGIRSCQENESWSSCVGQWVASAESCNAFDDDCDGTVDEGVTNECGTCNPVCKPDPPTGSHAPVQACVEDADAGAAVACDLPPSVCDGAWLVYFTEGLCVEGACRFTESYEYCRDGCYDGGCSEGFT